MAQQQPPSESALTDVSRLGEFGLIQHLTKSFVHKDPRVVKAIGDDAAVIQPTLGKQQIVSTDLLLEGVHFDLAYAPLRHLGYKAVVVNLSDIAAMNAIPYAITVSLGFSNRFPVEALDELYAGIQLACEKYQVELIGGDTTSSRQGLMISVTAFGEQAAEKIVYRNGAQDKDLICITGDVGAAYAGYLILDREKKVFQDAPHLQPDLNDYDYVVGRQLKPEARVDIIHTLANAEIVPTSMIDISDGVASELHHVCGQSKKGCTIYTHKLPIDWQTNKVAEEFKLSPTTFALNGGEDYELLFTASISDFDKLKELKGIYIVGHITPDQGVLQTILDTGEAIDLQAQGFQHFKSEEA